MSKVIVFGSLNMDLSIESDHMPNLGETIIGRGFITNPGGKGANQAVAAAKMGAAVCMLGAVGADAFGDQMIASLAEHGVTCEYITRSESCPTGVAIITRVCGDNFITIDAGANASTRIDAVRRALDEVAEPGDVFWFSWNATTKPPGPRLPKRTNAACTWPSTRLPPTKFPKTFCRAWIWSWSTRANAK